jgi:segregation and condensation protein B
MSEVDVLPELKQIIGAMLFANKGSLTPGEIRRCLEQVAETRGGAARDFAGVSEADIRQAVEALRRQLEEQKLGFRLVEVANGLRLENDVGCGPWLRQMLQKGRANRLSRPSLETLAIIAYRQPVTRGEIEAVRGVAVDQIIRNLMDLQLIKITGRSELPGRPWQFGTTQKFLEYFGLKNVRDLPGVEELRRMEEEQERRRVEAAAAAPAAGAEAAPEGAPAPEPAAASSEEVPMGREDIDRDYEGRGDEDEDDEEEEEEEEEADEEEDEDEYDEDDEDDEEEEEDDEEGEEEKEDR